MCWIHALVSALSYGFILEMVPDIRAATLEEIELMYAECTKYNMRDRARFRFSRQI